MLDIKRIREDPEPFRIALARRGIPERADELLAADAKRRELTTRVEELRAEQNKASKAIGKAQGDEKQALIAQVASVSAALKDAGAGARRRRGDADRVAGRHPQRRRTPASPTA